MSKFFIKPMQIRSYSDEEQRIADQLGQCAEDLNSVKARLRSKIKRYSGVDQGLDRLSETIIEHKRTVSDYQTALISIVECYEKTENKIAGEVEINFQIDWKLIKIVLQDFGGIWSNAFIAIKELIDSTQATIVQKGTIISGGFLDGTTDYIEELIKQAKKSGLDKRAERLDKTKSVVSYLKYVSDLLQEGDKALNSDAKFWDAWNSFYAMGSFGLGELIISEQVPLISDLFDYIDYGSEKLTGKSIKDSFRDGYVNETGERRDYLDKIYNDLGSAAFIASAGSTLISAFECASSMNSSNVILNIGNAIQASSRGWSVIESIADTTGITSKLENVRANIREKEEKITNKVDSDIKNIFSGA